MASKNRLRIGLIGAGAMGTQHAINIHNKVPNAEISAVYDIDEDRARKTAQICDNSDLFSDPIKLINATNVDAVVIAAPDDLHAKFAIECLNAEKPVLCEKPLASKSSEAIEIINKEVLKKRRLISVGFNRRFDPAHAKVKEICKSGKLGLPLLWRGTHRNPEAMYQTSGPFILMNSAGHDIDSARWLLESDIEKISVKGIRSRNELPNDSRDLLVLQMTMSNGLLAIAEVYVNANYGYEVIAEVVCQNGSVSTLRPSLTCIKSTNLTGIPITSDFRTYFSDSYLLEITSWVSSLQEGREFPGANAWDGYEAVAVSEAAGKSLLEDKPISVNLVKKPELYKV